MSFQYGEHDTEPGESSLDNLSDLSVVRVSVRSNPWENDLVSSLAAELAPPDTLKLKTAARRHVIFEPSEIIAFQLLRDALPPSYDAAVGRKSERAVFKYPKSVYLDQFMRESYELASAKRAEQRTLLAEVTELETRRKNLLHHNVSTYLQYSVQARLSSHAQWFVYGAGQGHSCRPAVVPVLLRARGGERR